MSSPRKNVATAQHTFQHGPCQNRIQFLGLTRSAKENCCDALWAKVLAKSYHIKHEKSLHGSRSQTLRNFCPISGVVFCTAIAQHKAENRHEASNHLAHCATKPHPVWANIKKFTMPKTCFHDNPDAPSKSTFLKQFVFEYCEKKQIKTRSYTKTILGWTNSEELQELQGPLQAKPKNAALENPKPRREALRDTLP